MARKKSTTEIIVPTAHEQAAAETEHRGAVARADAARALAEGERQANMMTLAGQIGYTLPEGISAETVKEDVRLHLRLHEEHQNEADKHQRAADEYLLRVCAGLKVLRAGCAHGEWETLRASLGISKVHAHRLIAVGARFTQCNNVTKNGANVPCTEHLNIRFPRIVEEVHSPHKLAELLPLSDDELTELDETGEIFGTTLAEISNTSAIKVRGMLKRAREREQAAEQSAEAMREALKRSRNENEALSRLLGEKNLEIEKLKRRDDGTGDNAAAFEDAIATLHARARGVRLAVAQMEDAAQIAMRYGDCLLLTAACVQMQIQALREIQGNMALPLLPDTDLPRFEQQVMQGRAAEYMADRDEDADAAWGDDDGQD